MNIGLTPARAFFARQLSKASIWTVACLLVIAVLSGIVAERASRDRGLTNDSMWLLDAANQRIEFYQAWLGRNDLNPKNEALITKSFAPNSALPPLMPALVASAKALSASETSTARVAARTNAVFFALFVLFLGLMGMEVGGAVGALTAAIGAASVPRIFGLATMVGFGMSTLFVLTATAYLLHVAVRSRWATLFALLGVAASVHVVFFGFLVWLPWLYIVATRPRREHEGTEPLRNLSIIPLGLALGFAAYPYLWFDLKPHLHVFLTHFLRKPAEPFSYAGQVWGHERLPWHAAPFVLLATMPPTLLLLAAAGLRWGQWYRRLSERKLLGFLSYLPFAPVQPDAVPDTRLIPPQGDQEELLRLAGVMLFLTLLLPLVLRSPYTSGVDLFALSVPWVLVFSAAGLARLVPKAMEIIPWRALMKRFAKTAQPRRPSNAVALLHAVVTALFAVTLVIPSLFVVARYHPIEESYYSWLVGGPEGARERGLPRNPRGPIPLEVMADIAAETGSSDVSVGFMLPGRNGDEALNRAAQEGLIQPGWKFRRAVFDSQVAILAHDDLDPRYEEAANNFFRTVQSEPEMTVITYERGAVPIFTVAIIP
ncbi:MAG: hypothetical protein CO108_28865 [Deltaproteobacteria bacterium CG_4_9_14_3_um_filter_63_12]|nr:MAG: hypothetical protein CO108_28865 [Deltaproteobacteria bacterium CG_4_9_14_3_um_filter_63_12]